MIFTEEQVTNNFINNYNAESILESAHYVDIPIISPNTIAVCEASITDDVSVGVIRYSDIESLCEEYGLDYDEALSSIANTNNIDINALCIAVDESEVILDPSIVEDIPNVVINPISENSLAYQYCELMLEAYINSGNERYLDAIINESPGFIAQVGAGLGNLDQSLGRRLDNARKMFDGRGDKEAQDAILRVEGETIGKIQHKARQQESIKQKLKALNQKMDQGPITGNDLKKKKAMERAIAQLETDMDDAVNTANKHSAGAEKALKRNARVQKIWNNKGKIAGGVAGAAAVAGAGIAAYKHFSAKKILQQAEGKPASWISQKIASLRNMYSQWLAKANHAVNSQQAGMIRKICAQIMNVIDSLMAKLQHMTA